MALIVGPKGRMVQGNPFVASTTDYEGKPMTKADGTPTQEFFLTVAYPKGDPQVEAYIRGYGEDCQRFWPNQFPKGLGSAPQFGATHPRFSSKVIDGDGHDGKGQPNSAKEGFAGHWLVRYATAYAIAVYEAGKYDPMQNLALDPSKHSMLKRGYFVRVASTRDTNASDQTPGIKAYPSMVEIVSAGPEITSGPDAGSVFGGAPSQSTQQPPAPPAPPAPGGLVATGKDGYTVEGLRAAGWTDDQIVSSGYATKPAAPPPPPPAPPAPPAPPPPPPAPPEPPAPPHTGFMNVDPNGPPEGFKMLPGASGATYKALIDTGWSHDQLVQHGMVGPS